jgi:hypothetical protein
MILYYFLLVQTNINEFTECNIILLNLTQNFQYYNYIIFVFNFIIFFSCRIIDMAIDLNEHVSNQ